MISPVAARELVHLLILQELAQLGGGWSVIAKGGVNLRLFFGSVRYSEGMDLDGAPWASAAIRACIGSIFEDAGFTRRLRRFGIRELDPGQGPDKDTGTTFRYKFGVIVGGGVRYPTKVEVSFRKPRPDDRAVVEPPDPTLLDPYGLDPIDVLHYGREAAIRQKIEALGGRREPQARDIFDLHVLLAGVPEASLVNWLAKRLDRKRLQEAYARSFEIGYKEYEGQVFDFLRDDARARYGKESAWDDTSLDVAAFIESIICRQEER